MDRLTVSECVWHFLYYLLFIFSVEYQWPDSYSCPIKTKNKTPHNFVSVAQVSLFKLHSLATCCLSSVGKLLQDTVVNSKCSVISAVSECRIKCNQMRMCNSRHPHVRVDLIKHTKGSIEFLCNLTWNFAHTQLQVTTLSLHLVWLPSYNLA